MEFNIFKIEKNQEDIRITILTNITRMFTERKLLDKKNLSENIKKITNMVSDDFTYSIILDRNKSDENKTNPGPINKEDTTCIVKLIFQKVSAVSKQSIISEFLIKYKNQSKLIVVRGINTKASQYITNNYTNAEVFLERELMINLIDHDFVPQYEVLDRSEHTNFCQTYQCKKRNIPKLLSTDPVARYYDLKPGDIVRFIRASETTGYSFFYRLVI